MRKYVVPCALLVGAALLSSRADAADLIIKSRAVPAGGKVSQPVYVKSGTVSANQLWGIDFALTFDNAALTAQDINNAFAANGATASDVVVTGAPTAGTGAPNPSVYVGFLKGTAGIDATKGLGLLKLQVAAGTAAKTVINEQPNGYNVANDGSTTTVARAAATGVTSTATQGAAVTPETVNVLDTVAGGAWAANSNQVPLHRIAVGKPGDVNGDGNITALDVTYLLQLVAQNYTLAKWDAYRAIAADVAGGNGYTPTNVGGTNGLGYGDNTITALDATAIKNKIAGTTLAANFPVPE